MLSLFTELCAMQDQCRKEGVRALTSSAGVERVRELKDQHRREGKESERSGPVQEGRYILMQCVTLVHTHQL